MNVKLAAQVLSSTVSRILSQYRPPEASGTARYCMLMNTFFDIMNIRDTHSHEFLHKSSLMPITSIDYPRLSWLRKVFLQYFEDWFTSIEQRDGNFSKKEKNKMFISPQTYGGLKISVNSTLRQYSFFVNITWDTFWLKDSVKTQLKIILEDNVHLKLGKIIHHKEILDIMITPSETKIYLNLLQEMYRTM